MSEPTRLEQWQAALAQSGPEDVLSWAAEHFQNGLTFATSLGAEDQVILDIIARKSLGFSIFMLDTGRLFPESYDLLAANRERYNLPIALYFPEADDVEAAVNTHGINFFKDSVPFRKHCCFIRKVKPLKRALQGRDAWITGMRREQSITRDDVHPIEWDAGNNLYKINPLWSWTADDVWSYIRKYDVPYNALHDNNFTSIGCAPCTRAIEPGEHERAGRWWWEGDDSRECGIHFVNGRVVRNQRNPSLLEAEPIAAETVDSEVS